MEEKDEDEGEGGGLGQEEEEESKKEEEEREEKAMEPSSPAALEMNYLNRKQQFFLWGITVVEMLG